MMITYGAEGVEMSEVKKREIFRWTKTVIMTHGREVGETGYMFVDDEKIPEVNNEYLGHNYCTDIITFDYDEDDVFNSDLAISLGAARSNVEFFKKLYGNELHRVIIHDILRLYGVNDEGPGERKIIEENGNKAFAPLKRI